MDPVVLVGVISGSSAIAASIGAQVIAAVVAQRSAAQRMRFDRERSDEQAASAREARFENEKREVFVEFMTELDELTDVLMVTAAHPVRAVLLIPKARALHSDLTRSYYRIKLICPSLEPHMDAVADVMGLDDTDPPRRDKAWEARLIPVGRDLRIAMSRHLGIDQLDSNPPALPPA